MVNLYLNLFFLYCNLVFPSNTEVTSGIIILLSEKHLNVVLLFCLWWVLPITVHLKMYSFSLYSWRIFFQKKIHIASYFCLYFKTLLVWFLTPIISVEKFTVLLKVLPWFIQFFFVLFDYGAHSYDCGFIYSVLGLLCYLSLWFDSCI